MERSQRGQVWRIGSGREAKWMVRSVIVAAAWLAIAFVSLAPSPALAAQPLVTANITADNGYQVWCGNYTSVVPAMDGVAPVRAENCTAGDIFNCGPPGTEGWTFTCPAGFDNYVFITTYEDESVTQGLLGEFRFCNQGPKTYTGSIIPQAKCPDPNDDASTVWRVFATGEERNTTCAAGSLLTAAEVDALLDTANRREGPAGSSRGWVGRCKHLDFPDSAIGRTGYYVPGELNNAAGGLFPQACSTGAFGIGTTANWMWYDPGAYPGDPNVAFNDDSLGEWLIYRLPIPHCSPTAPDPNAPPCGVAKSGIGVINVPSLGDSSLTLRGTAVTHVVPGPDPNQFTTVYDSLGVSGYTPVLGSFTISLDRRFLSTGTIFGSTFPALHQNNLRAVISSKNLGMSLVSDSPIPLEAPIAAQPPTANYEMTGPPVAFYALGDPNQETVLTLKDLSVDVSPRYEIPTLSEWGIVAFVLFLLGTGIFVVLRRKRLAT